MAYIYLVTNLLNGKEYVGQTINPKNKAGHGKLLTKSYIKHGKENFTYETICSGLDNKAILNFAERFWIKVIDCRVPNGYNIEHGGSSKDRVSAETRKKLSIVGLGRKHSEETKAKIAKASANISDETRAKLSAAHTGRYFSAETRAKMSKARLGSVVSDATKAKVALVNTGKKLSMETKQKLSDAAKRQWARQKGVA
jgi:group I intron endonuclease